MAWRKLFKLTEFGLYYERPQDFVTLKHGPQIIYVIWTALWLAYHLIWILMEAYWSVSSTPGKWMLLLTNLSYLALAVFALIDFLCCVFVFCLRSDILNGKIKHLPWYLKVQWVSMNICFHAAVQVTIIYWIMLASSSKASSVNKHGINTVFVLLVVCLSAKPLKFQHVYIAMSSSLFYIFFNLICFSVSGKILYPFLDWNKPGKAILLSFAFVLFSTPLSHFLLFGIHKFRNYIYERIVQPRDKNRNIKGREDEELESIKFEGNMDSYGIPKDKRESVSQDQMED